MTAGAASSSASPASENPPWSTAWCRTPTARSAWSTRSPARAGSTSSSAIALPLPDHSGWLIDTPGIRGFGLGHVTVQRVVEAFGDLAEGTAACPPGCDHLSPGCALDEWAAEHDALPRLELLRRLRRSRESAD